VPRHLIAHDLQHGPRLGVAPRTGCRVEPEELDGRRVGVRRRASALEQDQRTGCRPGDAEQAVEQFRAGGREDLVAKETAESRVLEAYAPPALDPAEIESAVDEAIRETGASSPKDMGRVMKAAMARLAGRGADGKTVNEIVRRRLG
jgi:hypothetical protein